MSSRLRGRAKEHAAIDRLLATVRDGLSATLVLRGVAGIGKTALLDECVRSASDLDIVRLVAIESEMELGFAGLHQLLSRYSTQIGDLPDRQARALRGAFGISDDVPDRFMVCLATLTLLSAVSSGTGLVIVIDDAQWLDRESASVVSFVARRFLADRVGVVLAVREPTSRELPFEALDSILVSELSTEDATDIVIRSVATPIADTVLARLLTEAQGNPLALSELPRQLSVEQLAGAETLPETIPLSARVEARFRRQVRALQSSTQVALLVAAADTTGDISLVLRCGPELGFSRDALDGAVADQLVSIGQRLMFRHPLIRSAIYHGASAGDRRSVHRALAGAIDAAVDPDTRAWHRAAASTGSDEAVAAELESAADRARERGGCAAAAVFLSRSADLSPDPVLRARRLLAAAEQEWEAGALERAQSLLEQAQPGLADGIDRARAKGLECQVLMWQGREGRQGRTGMAPAALLEAARHVAQIDVNFGRGILLQALLPAVFTMEFAAGVDLMDISREAFVMTLPPDTTPTCGDLLLDGLAGWFLEQYSTAAPVLREALDLLETDPESRSVLAWLGFGCWGAFALGDTTRARDLTDRFYELARDAGAWITVLEALHYRKLADITHGSMQRAYSATVEAIEIESARGVVTSVQSSFPEAWLVDEPAMRVLLESQRNGAGSDAGYALLEADYGEAVFELGRGHYQRAWEVWPKRWELEIHLATFGIGDLVEAAVRAGDRPSAQSALDRYVPRALASGGPLPLGLLARAQALLADGNEAERGYQESIVLLERAGARTNVGRSQLVYGEWLRREGRRVDARVQLRHSFELFDSIGAVHFAERARAELAASGESARRRNDGTRADLTAQEAHIARLASHGATNPEIAGQLFISSSTVDYHLRKVYRKLEITSRRELTRTLPRDD